MIFWKYSTIVGQNSGGAFIDHNITGATIQKISTTRRQARISLTVSQVSLSLFTNTSLNNYYQSSQGIGTKVHVENKEIQRWPASPKSTTFIPLQRKSTIATSATTHAQQLALLQSTCELAEEKSLIVATSAITLAQQLSVLEPICEHIQE